jgi:hypothetical protein
MDLHGVDLWPHRSVIFREPRAILLEEEVLESMDDLAFLGGVDVDTRSKVFHPLARRMRSSGFTGFKSRPVFQGLRFPPTLHPKSSNIAYRANNVLDTQPALIKY